MSARERREGGRWEWGRRREQGEELGRLPASDVSSTNVT